MINRFLIIFLIFSCKEKNTLFEKVSENLLSKDDNTKAITFISENGFKDKRNWNQLRTNTSKIIKFFKKIKIKEKDRIADYLPNIIETAIYPVASITSPRPQRI